MFLYLLTKIIIFKDYFFNNIIMELNFVKFTFPKITTEINAKGVEKKKVNNLPKWKEITRENYNKYIKPQHTGHAIITGEISNISAFDFDNKIIYLSFIEKYPYLKNHYTIETRNGFHIYFLYNSSIPTTSNALHSFDNVDTRNDEGIIFCPPTKYTLLDGSIAEYKFIGGEILPITDEILSELKINKPKIAKPIAIEVIAEKCQKLPSISIKSNVEEDAKYATAIIEHGLLNSLVDDYNNWLNVGFALKSIFRNYNNDLGLQLFKAFSSISEKYDESSCENYWNHNLNNFSSKKPITIGSLKKWAKESDSIKYKIIQETICPKENLKMKKKNDDQNKFLQDEEKRKTVLLEKYTNRDGKIMLPSNIEFTGSTLWLYDGCMTDKDASHKLFQLYPHWITCDGILYVFDFTTGMYSSNIIIYHKIITLHSDFLHIMLKDDTHPDWYRSEIRSYGNTTTLIDKILPFLKTINIKPDWLKQSQSSSLGKILFENGYYDFNTQLFHDSFNPDYVFFGKIHHAWTPFDDADVLYMESIKQRIFCDSMGKDVAEYFIQNLARGLSGECMKRILFAIGDTNCGKGVISTAISLSIGDYYGSFNAESLANRNTSQDEAQIMRWVLLLRYKRIVVSNEMKSGMTLNGNFIKKISSGGDELIGRTHCKEEEHFITHFLPIILDNDMNKITPYENATNERVRCLLFPKSFVDREPQNEFELPMDKNIKSELKTLRFQRCFVAILIQSHMNFVNNNRIEFEPDNVRNSKIDLIESTTDIDFMSGFLRDYEITNNDTDFVTNTMIETWIGEKKLNLSISKVTREIKRYIFINHLKNVEPKVKKVNKKSERGWCGIKLIKDDELEEEG